MQTPLDVLVLTHKAEKPQKSTVSSIKDLISNSENIKWSEQDIDPRLKKKSLLLFPSPNACQIQNAQNVEKYEQLVVIDGPWRRVRKIANDLLELGMTPVTISPRETRFWRYQQYSMNYLSSIEAIYYFFVEYETFISGSYTNDIYAPLLDKFNTQFELIQAYYRANPEKRFTQKKLDHTSYIKY